MRRFAHTIGVLAFGFWVLSGASGAWAFSADEPIDDPALEERAKALHEALRCMVCQGQSIADSNAELARDMRVIVRERVAAGESDDQVVTFLTDRYGDFVLLSPPVKPLTYVLWFGPALVLVAGVVSVIFLLRRRRAAMDTGVGAAPLTEEERRRLDALLDDES